jgi:hypothetical protein
MEKGKEVSEQFKTLFNELSAVINIHIKESPELEVRDFLAAVGICYVDIVRMAEKVDPEHTEVNRYRAIDYVSRLIFSDDFRKLKPDTNEGTVH